MRHPDPILVALARLGIIHTTVPALSPENHTTAIAFVALLGAFAEYADACAKNNDGRFWPDRGTLDDMWMTISDVHRL